MYTYTDTGALVFELIPTVAGGMRDGYPVVATRGTACVGS